MDARSSRPLPLQSSWSSPDEYIESLLCFITTSDLFRNLCGGVHVLDFLTREPDLYSWVLPSDWRAWFELVDIHDFLHLLMREDLEKFAADDDEDHQRSPQSWRGYPFPPPSLIRYIHTIRVHSLSREFDPISQPTTPLPLHIAVGMKPKKAHEVTHFATFVDQLSTMITESTNEPLSIVDFGSGQNYLGRTLACPPYNRHVVAIEQRHHNVEGAKSMDVRAKLATKEKIMRNKKEWKRQLARMKDLETSSTPPLLEASNGDADVETPAEESGVQTPTVQSVAEVITAVNRSIDPSSESTTGSMTYIEHALESGHLEHILRPKLSEIDHFTLSPCADPKSLVVSIHSCGNLTHHGLRSITLNPSVQAVAMIGCCYNLLTERLGPPTYKHPTLRSNHPRLESTSSTYDPHGFPMSTRLCTYTPPPPSHPDPGVRLNITARMMAVQAPYNWGHSDSESFFTRHFYRALLQRILLDRNVVKMSSPSTSGSSLSGKDTQGTPLIIGSLRKSAFTSFNSYVHAALEKLTTTPTPTPTSTTPDQDSDETDETDTIRRKTADLLTDPTIIEKYEREFAYARKHLAVIWSLMAFSAGVVESAIVVDRWLWLTEQPEVGRAWVQTVFGYGLSPRNLCVVGVKKKEEEMKMK